MANGKQRMYFSDLIGEKYKSWNNTKVILDGGTGSGKSVSAESRHFSNLSGEIIKVETVK